MARLEEALRSRRDAGGRSFVPYVTGGYAGVDAALLRALADAGADAIEVGIPFSDPVMDGGVIQEASAAALRAGATPADVLRIVAQADVDVPLAVMTYVNPVHRRGMDVFLDDLAAAGVSGLIVPDLLAAPGTDAGRLAEIGGRSRGFVYCVATYGVTGARDNLEGTARAVVDGLRPVTDLPLLVGVGIGTPEQAAEACVFADGVVVGSALMARVVARDLEGAIELAGAFRRAIPSGEPASPSPQERV
jgi:tryptophan synthase alpha chain